MRYEDYLEQKKIGEIGECRTFALSVLTRTAS